MKTLEVSYIFPVYISNYCSFFVVNIRVYDRCLGVYTEKIPTRNTFGNKKIKNVAGGTQQQQQLASCYKYRIKCSWHGLFCCTHKKSESWSVILSVVSIESSPG